MHSVFALHHLHAFCWIFGSNADIFVIASKCGLSLLDSSKCTFVLLSSFGVVVNISSLSSEYMLIWIPVLFAISCASYKSFPYSLIGIL